MNRNGVKRIVVRAPNWIGDAVMSTPALMSLRDLFPSAVITLLARPSISELLYGHPSLDDVMVYDHCGRHAGFLGKLALARALRQRQFDLAVLLQNALEAALLMFLAGIPAYGYATDGRGILLSESIAPPPPDNLVHQVHYYQKLVDGLGRSSKNYEPVLRLTDEEEQREAIWLKEMGIEEPNVLIGLNPGSTYGSAKRWLSERFAETAEKLVREVGAGLERTVKTQCVIVGAAGEETLGLAILERMRVKPIVLSGKTSVRQLMVVIKRCRLFVTNDTGPMHIASAFGVPLVAVFGPTDPRVTAPLGNRHAMVRYPVRCSPCLFRSCPIDHRCMNEISVDAVLQAADNQVQYTETKTVAVKSLSS